MKDVHRYRLWRGGMRGKLTLAFGLVALVGVSLVGAYGLFSTLSQARERANGEFITRALVFADDIEGSFRNVETDVLFLKETPPVQGIVRARDGGGFDRQGASSYDAWVERFQVIFEDMLAAKPFYVQLRYLDENGNELVRVDRVGDRPVRVPRQELQNEADAYYFQEAMRLRAGQVYVSNLDLNRTRDEIERPYQPTIRYATPVFDPAGRRRGVIIANVLATPFLQQQPMALETHGARLFIADQDGYYFRYDGYPDREWGGPGDLNTGHGLRADFPALAARVLSGQMGAVETGDDQMTFYAPAHPFPDPERFWVAGVIVPREVVVAPVRIFGLVFGGVFILSLALAVVMARLLATRITRPLRVLSQGASLLAAGELSKPVTIESDDEVGDLAANFNLMARALERRHREQAALLRLSQALIATLDLQTVMDEAVRISVEVLGCEAGALLLPDVTCEYLLVGASLGWDEGTLADVTIHAGQDTAAGYAFAHREPVLVPDMAWEARFSVPALLLARGLRSALSVPMLLGDETLGAMLLNSRHPGYFGEAEARLLSLIANQVAVVIENARLHEETRRRLAELSALFEVSSALREAHSVEEMLPIILDKSVEVMGAESGHLALLKDGGEELAIQAVRGISLATTGKRLKVAGLPARCPARTGQLATCPPGCPLYSREHTFICAPVTTPEGVLGTLCMGRTGDWPLPGEATRLLTTIADLAGNAVHRAGLHEELEEAYVQTVLALANAIDARDSYTGGHGERLAAWAMAVARELSCSEEEIELVRWGALLHDVGKIGVPDHILLKPGPLDDEERAVMQRHPEIGGNIVGPVKRLQGVAPIICHHHERWDGAGYPAGLEGEEIPLEGRILAVVDAYGAMTDERVYREARSHTEAVEELRHNAGTQFDPRVVEAFQRVLGGGAVEQGEGSDVVPAGRLSDHAGR